MFHFCFHGAKLKFMHAKIISLLVVLKFFCFAAFAEKPDTLIHLREVSVSARRHGDFGAGHMAITIDSLAIRHMSHYDIGTLLRRQTGIFIKGYGPGSLATTSLRGGTASQTALLWNGFNIQSPMNGQADLSLFPAFFVDELQVQYGGASALWGSGAMGGTIFINNLKPQTTGFSARAGINTASIGDFEQNLRLSYRTENFSTTLRAFNRNASNQYRFINNTPDANLVEQQLLAAFNQKGLLHETWFELGNNHEFDLRWWLQDNDRDIPPSLDFRMYESQQKDQSLRLSGQYRFSLPGLLLFVRGARFDEKINYTDNFEYDGTSRFTTLTGETEARWMPAQNLIVSGGINAQQTRANALEYETEKKRSSTALFASVKYTAFEQKLELVASGRQEFIHDYKVPFAPSMGASFHFTQNWALKANTGFSYLLPSLNDLYWQPGGNPNLQPEQGWSSDLRIERIFRESEKENEFNPFARFSAGVYNRKIKNWIVWLPNPNDPWLWSPVNRLEVHSYGLENYLGGFWKKGETKLDWNIRYLYTVAKNTKTGYEGEASLNKQLTYVPRNQAGINLSVMHKNLGLTYDHDFTGKRFISADNQEFLPQFHTGHLAVYWHYNLSSYRFAINLGVENLWNTNYQIIAHRPMPLRLFRAGISISYN